MADGGRRHALFFSALGLASVWSGFGCEARESGSPNGRSEAVIVDGAVAGPTLFGDRALAQALSALAEAARPPVRALSLTIRSDRVILQARHPSKTQRVVQYEYRNGHVTGPKTVELRGKGELEPNLFSLETVNLASVPALSKLAIERVDPQDGRVEQVMIRRNLPLAGDVQIRVFVDSPRMPGHLDADQSGKPLNRAQ
jgi:hypothetical protein